MTSLNAVQREMAEWSARHLSTSSPTLAALKVCEEAGEVAAAVVKPQDGSGRPCGDLAEELADVILAAATLAGFAAIDLEDVVVERIGRLWDRDRPPAPAPVDDGDPF